MAEDNPMIVTVHKYQQYRAVIPALLVQGGLYFLASRAKLWHTQS